MKNLARNNFFFQCQLNSDIFGDSFYKIFVENHNFRNFLIKNFGNFTEMFN